jgi:hypothetical protein
MHAVVGLLLVIRNPNGTGQSGPWEVDVMKVSASFTFAALLVACVSFAAEDTARTGLPGATDRSLQKDMVIPGDAWVIAAYDSPVPRPAGLGWDGTSLWMVSDSDQTIYKLDPDTMAVLDSMSTPLRIGPSVSITTAPISGETSTSLSSSIN